MPVHCLVEKSRADVNWNFWPSPRAAVGALLKDTETQCATAPLAIQQLEFDGYGPVVTVGAPLATGTVDVPVFNRDALIARCGQTRPATARSPSFWPHRGAPGSFATMSTSQRARSRITAAMAKSIVVRAVLRWWK